MIDTSTNFERKWTTGIIGIEVEYPVSTEELSETLNSYGYDVRDVGYTHDTYGRAVVKYDSSCGADGEAGSELVTPPTDVASLRTSAFRYMFEELGCDEVSDRWDVANRHYGSCGIHVHVGVTGSPTSNLTRGRLDRVWRAYDARWDSVLKFVGPGRDPYQSSFAQRYCGRYLAMGDKYGAVNASPLLSGRQSTVEFRQLGHRTDTTGALRTWAEVWEWAVFCDLLTESVAHIPGWIVEARTHLYGEKNPYGGEWSGFWTRPEAVLP